MASVFSHPAIALGLGPVFAPKVEPRVWALGAACSMVPDIDVIGFHYGIPYGDLFGHRGITHSLPFAALMALACTGSALSLAGLARAKGRDRDLSLPVRGVPRLLRRHDKRRARNRVLRALR